MALRGFAQDASAVKALEDRFKQLDKNGDGRITTAELPQSPYFKQRDKNGDGVITLAEAKAALEAGASPDASATKNEPTPAVNKARGKSPATAGQQTLRPLKPGDHGVGRLIADLTFKNVAGA